MSVYTQNHNIDGWPVCKDGEPMGRKDCLAELQKLEAQLAALKEEIGRLKARVAELEAKDPNLISTCGCRFENDTGNSVLLCDECSGLPCHNPNAETK